MAYSEALAERVRLALRGEPKVVEKKMMGGLTFMVNGKMCVGILREDLMARIDPQLYDSALTKKGCREMDFTGRPMRGFVFVSALGTRTADDLAYWIGLSLEFNRTALASGKQRRRSRLR